MVPETLELTKQSHLRSLDEENSFLIGDTGMIGKSFVKRTRWQRSDPERQASQIRRINSFPPLFVVRFEGHFSRMVFEVNHPPSCDTQGDCCLSWVVCWTGNNFSLFAIWEEWALLKIMIYGHTLSLSHKESCALWYLYYRGEFTHTHTKSTSHKFGLHFLKKSKDQDPEDSTCLACCNRCKLIERECILMSNDNSVFRAIRSNAPRAYGALQSVPTRTSNSRNQWEWYISSHWSQRNPESKYLRSINKVDRCSVQNNLIRELNIEDGAKAIVTKDDKNTLQRNWEQKHFGNQQFGWKNRKLRLIWIETWIYMSSHENFRYGVEASAYFLLPKFQKTNSFNYFWS